MRRMLAILLMIGICEATTCYNETTTSKPYDILHNYIVETRRGCEVQCDGKEKCAGFSLKDVGFSSECILLSANTLNQICAAETKIFLKQTEGCVARSNLAAEFGVDPCIDQLVPIQQQFGNMGICPRDSRILVVRAIDANGRRITLDNSADNWLEKSGDMWAYRFREIRIPVVAATCATAGSVKCPCQPMKLLTEFKEKAVDEPISEPPGSANYAAIPEQLNPCNANTALYWNHAKQENLYWYFPAADTPGVYVSCRAGMWLVWHKSNANTVGFTAMACRK